MSDLMLLGILRMPLQDNPAECDPMTWMQVKGIMREAAARIEKDAAEIEKLRAENIGLFARLDKAHSFISRADWMQFFEEEQEPAAALKETGE